MAVYPAHLPVSVEQFREFQQTNRWMHIGMTKRPKQCLVCDLKGELYLYPLVFRASLNDMRASDCIWLCKPCRRTTIRLQEARQIMCMDPYGIEAVKILLVQKVRDARTPAPQVVEQPKEFQVTTTWVDQHRTVGGKSWTAAQVKHLGLSYPLPSRWRETVDGMWISYEAKMGFERDKHTFKNHQRRKS